MQEATAERRARPQQPETIRIKGFIVKSSYGEYRHTAYDPRLGDNKYGDVVLGEHVVEFKVPTNFNAVAAEIEVLEAQVKAERLSCEQRVSCLTDRIAKLQSIEMVPSTGAAS